jgi:hypothetical protein
VRDGLKPAERAGDSFDDIARAGKATAALGQDDDAVHFHLEAAGMATDKDGVDAERLVQGLGGSSGVGEVLAGDAVEDGDHGYACSSARGSATRSAIGPGPAGPLLSEELGCERADTDDTTELRTGRFGAERLGDALDDFLLGGKSGSSLRRDDFAGDGNLEDAGVALNQLGVDVEFLFQRSRRTGGLGEVASGGAVGDGDHWSAEANSGYRCVQRRKRRCALSPRGGPQGARTQRW